MKKLLVVPVVLFLFSCNGDESNQTAPSPGILENTQQSNASDTGQLVTDSVVVRDTNTADVEPMKKIN